MTSRRRSIRWYADRAAWRLIGLRYLPWLAGLSLAWEIAQLPLYTLWREDSLAWIAFSVVHCTLALGPYRRSDRACRRRLYGVQRVDEHGGIA